MRMMIGLGQKGLIEQAGVALTLRVPKEGLFSPENLTLNVLIKVFCTPGVLSMLYQFI